MVQTRHGRQRRRANAHQAVDELEAEDTAWELLLRIAGAHADGRKGRAELRQLAAEGESLLLAAPLTRRPPPKHEPRSQDRGGGVWSWLTSARELMAEEVSAARAAIKEEVDKLEAQKAAEAAATAQAEEEEDEEELEEEQEEGQGGCSTM